MKPLAVHDNAVAVLRKAITAWRAGTGGVTMIAAEPGLGKSRLLDWLALELGEGTTCLRVDCLPPIGTMNTSAIQPLQPFGMAIEQLYSKSGQAARKRLALNVGMSLLASIPIAGDLFYAVKAISQDVSEYKRDTAAIQEKKRSAVLECANTLCAIAEKTPFVLLIDDVQWSDAQSVEVLRRLATTLGSVPLLIVCAVAPATAQRSNLPLTTLLRSETLRESTVTLRPVEKDSVEHIVQEILPGVTLPAVILTTIFERSGGNPGVIAEYARFLKGAGHVRADGTVDESAFDSVRQVTGSHPATDVVLREISEEDATILSLCAAEGKEFTAFLQAALSNTDVLTIIRTLRRIQTHTGLIKSVGMRTKYGCKTTVYEFSESFPYTYFLHRPEYEERRNIHQRIADILTKEYSTSAVSELRNELAVRIAAHGAEAENHVVVEHMLTVAAEVADVTGSPEIAAYIRSEVLPPYRTAANVEEGTNATAADDGTTVNVDSTHISASIRHIANAIVQGKSKEARARGLRLREHRGALTRHEFFVISCLIAKACIDLEMFEDAASILRELSAEADVAQSDLCLIKNVEGALALATNSATMAITLFREAAEYADQSPSHLRALTLGNIALHLRRESDPSHSKYEQAVRKLAIAHGWPGVRVDLGI